METRSWLDHEDTRVRAILALAQHSAELPAFDDAPLEAAVVATLPNVKAQDAVAAFRLIAADLFTAEDYEARGAEAVAEMYPSFSGHYNLSRDEFATHEAARARVSAQFNAELLVTTQDALAARKAVVS